MSRTRRVALHYPMRTGDGFLQGIFQYARPNKPWEFHLTFRHQVEQIASWSPDGLIGHALSQQTVEFFEQATFPVVETAYSYDQLSVPRVGLNDEAIGAMAADYFLNLGFTRFAFIGDKSQAFSIRRQRGFEQPLKLANGVLESWTKPGENLSEDLTEIDSDFRDWLAQLVFPTAIFAMLDILAIRVLEVARTLKIRVPEDLAVLGAGNSSLFCNLAYPPLSSIRTGDELAGYEAACLLDQLMEGTNANLAQTRIEVPPIEVVTRKSTDVFAVSDPDLAAALRLIRDRAADSIGVDDIVEAVGLSRSTLERRFRTILGRSPLDEIHNVRVGRARQALIETDLSMFQIAKQSGFRDSNHLAKVFQARLGESPSAFRKRFRFSHAPEADASQP